MKKFYLLFALVLSFGISYGQVKHPKTKQEIIAICDKFMDTFQKGRYADAFDLMKPYTVIEDYKLDTLANTAKEQMISVNKIYGKTLGFELVSEKAASPALLKVTYILKFEQSVLKFRFILYNNELGWTIIKFKYDVEIDDLF